MLELVNIQKFFGNAKRNSLLAHPVLDSICLQIQEGEFFSLLGPSGCGKTTLLRIIAGLETADAGQVLFQGKDLTSVKAQKRPFHMVFQKHALFPHLTVFENVAFGLRLQGMQGEPLQTRVSETLALVQLTGFESRYPETLSGGQSQRTALARALATRPQVLLLDEPLSALDQKLRETMQTELRLLQKRLGITFIYVTHDQEEAFAMSDRVAVMNQGRLEQVSDPVALYHHPQSLFAAEFVGFGTSHLIRDLQCQKDGRVTFVLGQQSLTGRTVGEKDCQQSRPPKATGVLVLRPEALQILPTPLAGYNSMDGTVTQVTFRGAWTELRIRSPLAETDLQVFQPVQSESSRLRVGQTVHLGFRPEDGKVFWGAE